MRANIVVSAFGKVRELLLPPGIDESRLGSPALGSQKAGEKPFPVWRPVKPLVAVLVGRVQCPGKDQTGLFGFEVQDLQRGAVLQVGDFFSVRGISRLEMLLLVFQDWMDVDDG